MPFDVDGKHSVDDPTALISSRPTSLTQRILKPLNAWWPVIIIAMR